MASSSGSSSQYGAAELSLSAEDVVSATEEVAAPVKTDQSKAIVLSLRWNQNSSTERASSLSRLLCTARLPQRPTEAPPRSG